MQGRPCQGPGRLQDHVGNERQQGERIRQVRVLQGEGGGRTAAGGDAQRGAAVQGRPCQGPRRLQDDVGNERQQGELIRQVRLFEGQGERRLAGRLVASDHKLPGSAQVRRKGEETKEARKASFVVLLLPGLAAGRASFGVEPAVALNHLSKAAVEIAFDERASLRTERSQVLDFPLEAAVEVFPIGQLSGPLLRRLSSSSSSSSSSPPTTTACISLTSAPMAKSASSMSRVASASSITHRARQPRPPASR